MMSKSNIYSSNYEVYLSEYNEIQISFSSLSEEII